MRDLNWSALKVLVVDDNVFFRDILRSVLAGAGVTHVRDAGGADEALKALREGPTDLILLDYVMAPVDGLELTRMLRDEAESPEPTVPIVMVSGHMGPGDRQTALATGVHAVVGKPINATDLLRTIRHVLAEPLAFVRTDTYFGPDHSRRTTDLREADPDHTFDHPMVIDVRAGSREPDPEH
ncbi:response regulator [Roseospira navarrensis]|nr:response regulator [Roseospira navarrensis]